MKAFRSPVVLVGLVVLVVVLAASLFVGDPLGHGNKNDSVAAISPKSPGDSAAAGANKTGGNVQKTSSSAGESTPAIRWELLEGMAGPAHAGIRITKEDAETFLKEKGTTAINLLVAASVTGDEEFVRRAAKLFPDHPAVLFALLSADSKGKSITPEVRAEQIARFKTAAPENPLPYIYAANDAFQRKDPATALAEASRAIEMPGLYFWSAELIEARMQFFEFKGYSPLEAEVLAAFGMSVRYVEDFRKLGGDLLKLSEQALKDGNTAAAENAAGVVYSLGRMFSSPEGNRTIVTRHVGLALEASALKALPADLQPSFLDIPRARSEAEMAWTKDYLRELVNNMTSALEKKNPALLAGYLQRFRNEGEYQALLWLKEQAK